jgi:hypothetical protein
MQFPPNMISVKRWYAFKAKLPPGSSNEHRVIIVYKHQTTINYFYVTSQVETVIKLARYDTDSIVKLKASDWDALTKDSCIQCNERHLYEINESDFKQIYANGDMKYLGEIPENVKSAIIYAICMSNSFTEAEKIKYTI